MNWLVLSWFLTLGFAPMNNQMIIDGSRQLSISNPGYEQEVGLTLTAANHARAFFSIKTYEVKAEGLLFAPFRSDYSIGAEIFTDHIILGIRHECDHTVVSHTGPAANGYYLGLTEVYLTFQGSVPF